MGVSNLVYGLYERRLRRRLDHRRLPEHVGAIVDGNRRWARGEGTALDQGYQAGADKIVEFVGWCHELNVQIVTLWLLSTDNLERSKADVDSLLSVIGELVDKLAASRRWRLQLLGSLALIPDEAAQRLTRAIDSTSDIDGMRINVCVGYGGRQELTDAMRELLIEQAQQGSSLEEIASKLDVEDIADHLYTKGQPDPDLLIRTSGEQRLSGFLLWQSVHSEFYFCDALWPAFRHVDFLRAMRSYASRDRRYGH